jgi:hypothetical protein
MSAWIRAALVGVVLAVAAGGVLMLRTHWIALGAAEVQARWDRQVADANAKAALAAQEFERQERLKDQTRQQENERIARENHARVADLEKRLRSTDARNRSLLDTIATLNARDAGLSGASPDAGAGPGADGPAAIARELLGRCASRYAAVAGDAGGLASQVIGLQQYVRQVCGAAAPGENDDAGEP